MNSKAFVFAYPIPEYIDHCVKEAKCLVNDRVTSFLMSRDCLTLDKRGEINGIDDASLKSLRREHELRTRSIVRQLFYGGLNRAVDERYRYKGYDIYWHLFAGHVASPLVSITPGDHVIEGDITFAQHTAVREDGTHPYTDTACVVKWLGHYPEVVVTGYHLHDCVDKIAAALHGVGCKTLVDEDLTEWFLRLLHRPGFRLDSYPSLTPRYLRADDSDDEDGDTEISLISNEFAAKRRKKEQKMRPWLYQW